MSQANEKIIQLKDIWKIYNEGTDVELAVLKGISLDVEPGSFNVLLGPSGSGKSTLLHIMSCLDVPTRGQVILDGTDISKLSDDKLAEIRGKKIGFVFQRFNLLSQYTALENVAVPLTFQNISEKEAEDRSHALLESVGLGKRGSHRPGELSGGEQQRVAIARSLALNPPILVADEPTGNVDTKTGEKIMKIITDLNEKQGRTIIVVTHDEEMTKYASNVVRIRDGVLE